MNIKIIKGFSSLSGKIDFSKGIMADSSTISNISINNRNAFIVEETALDTLAVDWLRFSIKELMNKDIKTD